MLLEVDEIVLPKADYEAAKAGDRAALSRIKQRIDDLQIYFHAYFPAPDEDCVVTLRDLEELCVIEHVTIKAHAP